MDKKLLCGNQSTVMAVFVLKQATMVYCMMSITTLQFDYENSRNSTVAIKTDLVINSLPPFNITDYVTRSDEDATSKQRVFAQLNYIIFSIIS